MGHHGLSRSRADAAQQAITEAGVGPAELARQAVEQLRSLPYPRYYLDLQTIAPAIPLWNGTLPYRPVPFQWSCHVENADGDIRHAGFLDTSGEPPMAPLAQHLLAILGSSGPVFTFRRFEELAIRDLAKMFPGLAARLEALIDRIVDLHAVVQAHFDDPCITSSWSLRSALPVLAPRLDGHRGRDVRTGAIAEAAYLEIIDPDTAPDRRRQLATALRESCHLETLALLRLAQLLQQ